MPTDLRRFRATTGLNGSPFVDGAVAVIRAALGVLGLLMLLVGALILLWPGKTAAVVTAIVAGYALLGGLVYAGLGIVSRVETGWSRVGHIALGGLFVVAGVVALAILGATTAWLAAFLGILVGIMWLVEGVVALSTLGDVRSKAWTTGFALLSIVTGLALLLSPLYAVALLWWLLGLTLVLLGVLQLVRAAMFGRQYLIR